MSTLIFFLISGTLVLLIAYFGLSKITRGTQVMYVVTVAHFVSFAVFAPSVRSEAIAFLFIMIPLGLILWKPWRRFRED